MTFDEPPGRAYPYRTGWKFFGCVFLLSAGIGAAGTVLVPACCDQWRNGNNAAFAVLAVAGAPCTVFSILFAVLVFAFAVKDAVRPALVRVTPAALLLPDDARGQPLEKDERGAPKYDGPRTHPAAIPFTAIRWVRREAGTAPGEGRLLIVHELSPATLELHQYKMRPADFDELETVLRAAVPEAFAALPVPSAPPPSPSPDRPDGA
ncbi:MAG: hypothetical protein J0I06_19950 [Planctomycetes bacterium]|nr:hypothetical protein [Planctomycetota bacterium]